MATLVALVVEFFAFIRDRRPEAKAERTAEPSETPNSDPRTYELLYTEGLRALDHQQDSLDELRARAGILLTAAILVASFLAPSATGPRFSSAGALATGFFLLAMLLLIVLLRAKRGWAWGVDLHLILDLYIEGDPPATLAVIHRSRGYYIGKDLKENQDKLDRLSDYFGLATVFVAAEVVFWLAAIAQKGP